MNLETFWLQLEPLTAKAVGLSAAVVAPVVDVVNKTVKADPEVVESLANSARDLTKYALIWGIGAVEQAQSVMAEAEESFRDLVAEAQVEHAAKKTATENGQQQPVDGASELS